MKIIFQFFAIYSFSLLAASNSIDEDTFRIMSLELEDRSVLSEQFTIYQEKAGWWIPFQEFVDTLQFAVDIDVNKQEANGFITQEANTIQINFQKCSITLKKIELYDCSSVTKLENEFYITHSLLEKWFSIQFQFDLLKSKIIIRAKNPLPVQLRRQREETAQNIKSNDSSKDRGLPVKRNPRSLFNFGTLDETLSFSHHKNENEVNSDIVHTTQLGGELLGLETYTYIQGRKKSIDGWRLQLSRKDRLGRILGPLSLTEIQFVDVDAPSLPLIVDSNTGKGFFFTSQHMDMPQGYDKHDFQGVLLPGWEVLLFRNDTLLARQVSNDTGQYNFSGIDLLYGKNNFKLQFFGPRGEYKEFTQTFNIDGNMMIPYDANYWLSMTLVPSEKNAAIFKQRTAWHYQYGLPKGISLATGYFHEKDSPHTFGYLGLAGANPLFIFGIHSALSTTGGKAIEWFQKTSLGPFDINFKYNWFHDYKSPRENNSGIPETDRILLSLFHLTPTSPSIGLTWDVEQKNFIDQTSQNLIRNRLSTFYKMFSFNNELSYTLNSTNPVSGKFDLGVYPSLFRLRFGINYNQQGLQALLSELNYRLFQKTNLTFGIQLPVFSKIPNYRLSATQSFDLCSISFDSNFTDVKSYAFGTSLIFTLLREPHSNSVIIRSEPSTPYGSASILVYLDKNRNFKKEEEEPTLSGLYVNVNSQIETVITDSKGIAFIPELIAYTPTDLSLSYKGINNPNWKPANQGFRFYARPSQVYEGQLPVHVVGSIDGTVARLSNGIAQPLKRVRLLLYRKKRIVKSTFTDKEGFYIFEDLAPGNYEVKVEDSEKWSVVTPEERKVKINQEGSFESSQDFTIL